MSRLRIESCQERREFHGEFAVRAISRPWMTAKQVDPWPDLPFGSELGKNGSHPAPEPISLDGGANPFPDGKGKFNLIPRVLDSTYPAN